MNAFYRLLLIVLVSIGMLTCQGSKKSSSNNEMSDMLEPTDVISDIQVINKSQPSAIVYKTVSDFYDYIPVIMDNDKNEIISYPCPQDVLVNGKFIKPLRLKSGYLLDNRGINQNVVFLTYTYEEYGNMEKAPSLDEMKKNIKERYPLKELINCGARIQYKNEETDLNNLIEEGFPGCERIEFH